MLNKIVAVSKKITFGISAAAIGVLAFFFASFIKYNYEGSFTKFDLSYPVYAARSYDGFTSINDSYSFIYTFDENKNIHSIIQSSDIPGVKDLSAFSFFSLAYSDDGSLYAVATVVNSDIYITDYEVILEFDRHGKYVRELCRFDYSDEENPPIRTSRLSNILWADNCLNFSYKDNEGISFISLDPSTSLSTVTSYMPFDEDGDIYSDLLTSDGYEYTCAAVDGSVYSINTDGTIKCIAKSDYDISNPSNSFIASEAVKYDEQYYAVNYHGDTSLWSFGNDGYSVLTPSECGFGDEENSDYGYYFGEIFSDCGKLWFSVGNTMVCYTDGTEYNYDFNLPAYITLLIVIKLLLHAVGIVGCVTGIISVIGCIMRWRLSLTSKQLLLVVPVVLGMVAIIIITSVRKFTEVYYEDVYTKLIAVNSLALKSIDTDYMLSIRNSHDITASDAKRLINNMSDITDGNKSLWSKTISCKMYLYDSDNDYLSTLVTSVNYPLNYIGNYYDEYDGGLESHIINDCEFADESSNTYITLEDNFISRVTANTLIYDDSGKFCGLFESSTDLIYLEEAKNEIIKNLIIQILCYIPILIAAVWLITYISIRYLRNASHAVSRIASGDFSARIEKSPKDEVGEICRGVNDMALQLENYFEEKDKNEKFYYKFVPEQFRELLNKEKITDLTLGDAVSADLTVLFCDIRSFSLNSEMMTAKENFEFVNIIYGKAGPVIRKHGGFVDKYIGDAVMSLFENADEAVAAGIELYHEIVLNPETARELNVSTVNIGIGIHSGMARIGIVGEEERLSGTVISNTVNLSSRLESLTKKYATAMIISKDTLDRMSDPDSLNTRYLGMVQVAGVNEVKALYEVLDCLEDERRITRAKSKDIFREAVKLFHLGCAEKSLEELQRARQISPDPTVDMYIKYVEEYIRSCNSENNVFRFTRK